MGTVPIGTGDASRIALRIPSMSPPVERSITVSAPYLMLISSFRTSPDALPVTALLPMFALTLQSSAIPMPMGSRRWW